MLIGCESSAAEGLLEVAMEITRRFFVMEKKIFHRKSKRQMRTNEYLIKNAKKETRKEE
jgi:hypothetical protein